MSESAHPRVLNLIDPANPMVGPSAAALLVDGATGNRRDHHHVTLLISGSTGERLMSRLGLPTVDRIHAPAQRPWLAATPLRRFIRRAGPFGLVHAWSIETLTLAAIGAPGVPKVLTLVAPPASRRSGHWLRMLVENTGAVVLVTSNCVKRDWAACGVPVESIHVLRPGLDTGRLVHQRRDDLRKQWGIDSTSTFVIGAPAHPAPRVDSARAARIAVLSRLTGLDVALVISPRAQRVDLGHRFAIGGGCPDRFIVDERIDQPWKVAPGLDAALILGADTGSDDREVDVQLSAWARMSRLIGRSPGKLLAPPTENEASPDRLPMTGLLPMHWAAAAGKVIIAEASYAASEVIENRQSGLLTTPGDDEMAVQRIDEVVRDPQLAWSLRDAARSEAFSVFSRQRYASDLETVYEQIVGGQPVRVPDLPVTGGMLFSGRA